MIGLGKCSAVGRLSERLSLGVPVGAALAYPWALYLFHQALSSPWRTIIAPALLASAFALPLSAIAVARLAAQRLAPSAAVIVRTAFAALAAPPLFVLTGVVSGLLHSPVRDIWAWSMLWLLVGVAAVAVPPTDRSTVPETSPAALRVAHGVSALIVLSFVAFHLANHLTGLIGPETHARVMRIGRTIYRSSVVEPLLVALLLFQVASGIRLAWRWSRRPLGVIQVLQVGSGVYLAAFVLTHLNSALISARMVHRIPTDWAWASGAPERLLADAWNVRLVPHYALGVFFLVVHLACGLCAVLKAHGFAEVVGKRVVLAGVLGASLLSFAILGALCGLRIQLPVTLSG